MTCSITWFVPNGFHRVAHLAYQTILAAPTVAHDTCLAYLRWVEYLLEQCLGIVRPSTSSEARHGLSTRSRTLHLACDLDRREYMHRHPRRTCGPGEGRYSRSKCLLFVLPCLHGIHPDTGHANQLLPYGPDLASYKRAGVELASKIAGKVANQVASKIARQVAGQVPGMRADTHDFAHSHPYVASSASDRKHPGHELLLLCLA